MATILQLSEETYLNLDIVTVLRHKDGQWQVWHGTAGPLFLTNAEIAVLGVYLRNHTERRAYYEWREGAAP